MAAGEPRYLEQGIDYLGFLEAQLRDLRGVATLVYELVQNADDVKDERGRPGASCITFDLYEDALVVENDGVFRQVDFDRMQTVASGGKRDEVGTTGAFGIGFIAVYQVTDHPEILSSGRHWIIRPDAPYNQRIEERNVQTAGTRFRLPWAFNPQSEVRRKLRLEAVRSDQLAAFESEVAEALSLAALFLKQVRVLELRRAGELVKRVQRDAEGNEILIDENGGVLIWRVFQGNFEREAAQLRDRCSWIEAKRHSDVLVAIPDELPDSGRLFAVLPSETETPLPFHINADFFPTSDRKRIIFGGDYQSEWNRAAIKAAARVLADGFDELPSLLGHKGLWRLIESLDECRRQAERDRPDRVFAAFWEETAPGFPERRVVFTTDNRWVTPSEARLLESDAEEQASAIVQAIGISVVHPDLRPHFGLLRQKEIGTPLLEVQDFVAALRCIGLDKKMPLVQAPPYLKSVEDWRILWNALDALLERRHYSENLEQAQEALRSCVIALDTDDSLQSPRGLFRGDAVTRELFPDVPWMAEYCKPDKVPGRLVPLFEAGDAVEFLSALPEGYLDDAWQEGKVDLEALYRWFEGHKSEILGAPDLRESLRALPIWPASGRLCPLSALYMPGGFDDPLGLSTLVDLSALGGRREFLKDLGVQELTFNTYAREQIPRVFENSPDLAANACRKLVQLLAQRLGELRDDEDLWVCLCELPLVECSDGVFRPAGQVYAWNETVPRILGDRVHIAASVDRNVDAVEALYDWLGVAREPRLEDVIGRVYQVTAEPPNEKSLQVIEAVFGYLVDHWPNWLESDQLAYTPLKNMAWLPGTDGRGSWYRPDQVYAIFRAYLFQTQATFLDLPRRLQERAGGTGGLLAFLEVQRDPSPELVVRHLLHCSERSERVNKEVYRFLNEQAEDPAIDQLRGQACLLLPDDTYVRPDQVYWDEHPFGQFRYQLDPELRQYSALFDRLGVRERPREPDFVQVLLEISEAHGERHTPLDEQTHAVVMRCWEELSTALEEERITTRSLKELRGKLVIPDPRTEPLLTKPDYLFFEDRAGLAAKFDGFLQNSVIARPQGAWRAMEAVGVQRLSRAVELRLLECEDPTDDRVLAESVADRRPLIARLVESERASGAEGLELDALDQILFRRAQNLEIQYLLQAYGRTVQTAPESVPALLIADEHTLFTVYDNGQSPGLAVARELAYAIKSIGEIGGLAVGIKEVLASDSFEEACQALDELGYPPIQEQPGAEIASGNIVSGLGGDEMTAEEAIGEILAGGGQGRGDMPETPSETPPGGDTPGDGSGKPPKTRKRQSKLRTYVVGEGAKVEGEPDSAAAARRSEVDQAGIGKVLEYERGQGRTPAEMDHHNEGFDVESCDAAGEVRYIEVKSLSGDWGTRNAAGLTRAQFEFARDKGEASWLYVVERATSDNCQIHCIQNPANRVNQYLFDDGWQALAESADGGKEESE